MLIWVMRLRLLKRAIMTLIENGCDDGGSGT